MVGLDKGFLRGGNEPGAIGGMLAAAVGDGRVPGVVAAAGRGPVTLATWAAGQADTLPGTARPVTAGTIFDLASLTKVVATTTAILALIERGQLRLDDAVTGFLPDFAACRAGPVTIRHLLTHTSGLPDTRRFDQCCSSPQELRRALHGIRLQAPPGSRIVYSDLGFLALGEIAAAAAGQPLEEVVRDLVTGPLGMTGTGFCPLAAPLAVPPAEIAATEPRGDGTAWTGVVHDENARLLGGVAGHAGLFAPAADLARFAAWWVSDGGGPVSAGLRHAAASCQTAGLDGRRGLGWACAGDGMDVHGGSWPATAVSHSGFTGTSLVLDPASGGWLVLLTNAVHFGRDHSAIRALRRQVHAAAAPLLT
ncbi:MAG TPA: serine hydrolase domain-containing protein [Streptosporangiaceae bacterium]|nr:serine hydrolase domain-containing protein [Streptosporangiaceae bacterium]